MTSFVSKRYAAVKRSSESRIAMTCGVAGVDHAHLVTPTERAVMVDARAFSLAKYWARLSICCAILYGCSSNETDRPSGEGSTAERLVEAKPLPGGNRTRAALYETQQHRETTAVIRTEAAWDSMWQRIGPAPRPEIDFGREMLIVAGLALGGWDRDVSIRIDGARPDSLVAIVRVRHSVPDLCGRDAFRAPMAIVRVPRDPRPVVFRQEVEHLNCGR
jgi:hypothetical protein